MEPTQSNQPATSSKTPRRLGFAALLAVALFGLTRGCSSVNPSASWLSGTAWFTGAAICLIVGIWLWEYTVNRHLLIRLGLSVLVVLVIGIGSYSSIRDEYHREHMPKESLENPPKKVSGEPFLKASLVVDSVTDKKITYHTELENGPTFTLREILFRTQSPDGTHMESETSTPRELAPNEKLSGPSDLCMLKPRSYNKVNLVAFYTATVDGVEKHYSCTYDFLFSLAQAKKNQAVYPESIERGEGQPIARAEDVKNTISRTLDNTTGTITFALPETHGGHPNIVRFGNNRRQFIFDPVARQVFFKTKTNLSKIVSLSQKLRPTENGNHIITLIWDDVEGGALRVDRIEKGDMKNN